MTDGKVLASTVDSDNYKGVNDIRGQAKVKGIDIGSSGGKAWSRLDGSKRGSLAAAKEIYNSETIVVEYRTRPALQPLCRHGRRGARCH